VIHFSWLDISEFVCDATLGAKLIFGFVAFVPVEPPQLLTGIPSGGVRLTQDTCYINNEHFFVYWKLRFRLSMLMS
jgi:hypothetical protein